MYLKFCFACIQHCDDAVTTIMGIFREGSDESIEMIHLCFSGAYANELELNIKPSLIEFTTIGEKRDIGDFYYQLELECEYYLEDIYEHHGLKGSYTWTLKPRTLLTSIFAEVAYQERSKELLSNLLIRSNIFLTDHMKNMHDVDGGSYINVDAIHIGQEQLEKAMKNTLAYFSALSTKSRPKTASAFGEW